MGFKAACVLCAGRHLIEKLGHDLDRPHPHPHPHPSSPFFIEPSKPFSFTRKMQLSSAWNQSVPHMPESARSNIGSRSFGGSHEAINSGSSPERSFMERHHHHG